jgi:hypothetical protein
MRWNFMINAQSITVRLSGATLVTLMFTQVLVHCLICSAARAEMIMFHTGSRLPRQDLHDDPCKV